MLAKTYRSVASLALLAGLVVLVPGCLGSEKTYRPYKGEPRPDPETREDPIVTAETLKRGVPRETDESTVYLEHARKTTRETLDRVHKNDNGSPRNAWFSYEDDMLATLGPGTLKRIGPRPKPKPDGSPIKKPVEPTEGEGEKKPAEGDKPAGDKPAGDKPVEGDKPADGGGG